MQLSAQTLNLISKAATPEEAYKLFAGAVSQGLGDLVADALSKAIGGASVAASNPAIAGWEKHVKGLAMSMNWGTPGYKVPPTQLVTFSTGVLGANANPSIAGGSITIGGSWTF